MGYAFCYGQCVNCLHPFFFNPNWVPSIRVGGKREPLCEDCFHAWNKIHRTSKGLAPVELHPHAYMAEPEENL